jgi:hypothetical protein
MALSRREIESLIKTVSLTRSNELDCGDCLQELAEFAESTLTGKSISEGLEAVEHHLAVCNECKEEFEALLKALEC